MTDALGLPAPGPTYRTGCKRGHAPLRLRGDDGACLKCGRQDPPAERLTPAQLAANARRAEAKLGGLGELGEAVAQTALKMRALAVLEGVDPLDRRAYRAWANLQVERRETVDERLRARDEGDVRWAVRAAQV